MANRKEMVIVHQPNGCIIQTSHSLNHDGYFRKRVWVDGKLKSMMYHRHIWEIKHGQIPEGYEVDHKCKNRACFNPDHLQLLTSTQHRTKDNTGRYSDKKQAALAIWLEQNKSITGTALAGLVGVTFSAACGWIREWRKSDVY